MLVRGPKHVIGPAVCHFLDYPTSPCVPEQGGVPCSQCCCLCFLQDDNGADQDSGITRHTIVGGVKCVYTEQVGVLLVVTRACSSSLGLIATGVPRMCVVAHFHALHATLESPKAFIMQWPHKAATAARRTTSALKRSGQGA